MTHGHCIEEANDLRAELDRLRLENHRLGELVKQVDLVHIRLRAGLREACDLLDSVDWLTFPNGWEIKDQREATAAELRRLLK